MLRGAGSVEARWADLVIERGNISRQQQSLVAPVSGEVVEVNAPLKDRPETVNKNPHDAWMLKVRISNPGDAAGLLDSAQYQGLLG